MTDRFEDAVRDAARGLSSPASETPTYHAAWQRGRRRRLIKRSALAAAGVVVFVAALAINLGRIPGPGTNEVDDIATGVEAPTAIADPTADPTPAIVGPVPTAESTPAVDPSGSAFATGPSPTEASQPDPTVPPAPTATPEPAPTAQPAESPTPEPPTPESTPEPTPESPTPESPTPEPTAAAPTATPVPPTATPEPTTPEPTVPVPTPTPVGSDDPNSSETGPADPDAQDPFDDETDEDPDNSSTTQVAPDPGPSGEPEPTPGLSFTSPGPPDAVLLAVPSQPQSNPCDLDGDLAADATCDLLYEYPCSGAGDVRPGFIAVDYDGDEIADTCIADGITMCDTTLDGMADTPCIIELLPAAEGQDADG